MFSFVADNIDDLYKKCLKTVLTLGDTTHPRGFNCRELSPCTVTLVEPQRNILANRERKASLTFMGAELLWMLMGRDDVDMLSFYNSKMTQYSDDGKKFFGAYGPKIVGQLEYIIENLQKDPWSRQAIINIWQESPAKTKDVPCTVSMHFLRRPIQTLNMVVYMRSQDLWLGFPYDVHNFTSIQLILASILGCNPGAFTLIQGSLHLYEQDFEKAEKAANEIIVQMRKLTPLSVIKSLEEFNSKLLDCERVEDKIRNCPDAIKWYERLDPLLDQKLEWLYDYARKKHEPSNH